MTASDDAAFGDVDVVVVQGVELGERPVWDEGSRTVVWVDIPTGQVHRYDPETGLDTVIVTAGVPVGAAAPRVGGGLVLACGSQFRMLDADLATQATVEVLHLAADVGFNDGAVDPAGRFLAGTAAAPLRPGAGSLFALEPNHVVRTVFDDVVESNGLGWSPSGTTMYYVDSGETHVRRYDYDVESGAATRVADLVQIPDGDGIPDGLVVDVDGAIWLALWEGGQVRRYSPDGAELARIELPATQITCPGFAGNDLRDLYVTSARSELTDQALAQQPLAGALFRLRPGVSGLPVRAFAG